MPLPTTLLNRTRAIAPAAERALAGSSPGYIWDLPFEYQSQPEWCWVAVGLCLARKAGRLGFGNSQCELASHVRFEGGCCDDPFGCNSPHSFDTVLQRLGWAFDQSNATAGPVTFEQIADLLDDSRPVVAQIRWDGGNQNHLVIIHGYKRADRFVYVRDPLFGPPGQVGIGPYDRRMTYARLLRYTRDAEPDEDDVGEEPDADNPIGRWVYTFHPRVL